MASLAFPALLTLTLDDCNADLSRQLIAACPALQRLSLLWPQDLAILRVPQVRASLVYLESNEKELHEAQTDCPRIEELHQMGPDLHRAILATPRFAESLLPRLSFVRTPDGLAALYSAAAGRILSRMVSLCFTVQPLPSISPCPAQLPSLRTLVVWDYEDNDSCTLRDAVAQVRTVAATAPCLRRLCFYAPLGRITSRGVDEFICFLQDMSAHGVNQMTFGRKTIASPRLKACIRSLLWVAVDDSCYAAQEVEAPEGEGDAWETTK